MKCPIEGCTAGRFTSKCKNARHWTEKHVQTSIKYHCSVRNCTVTCRRRYDMKTHLKEVHRGEDGLRVENLTCKCDKTVMKNRGYIDPGFLIFKGRTIKSVPSTASSTSSCPPVQSTINTSSIATTNTTTTSTAVSNSIPTVPYFSSLIAATTNTSVYQEGPEYTVTEPSKYPSSKSSRLPSPGKCSIYTTASDIRIIDCNTSFGIAANSQFTDGSCQTSSLELQPLVLPPSPKPKRN
ncbi:unnamed protein product [Mytilus edulis]|uniref:C2H2-type domain-containing protein n=1 Tax=Mytilus edulis TaxID=6550 RepID=A0A8S3TR57_MYTED|nr:unnamed protein product [Mytilus edulis]